MTALVPLKRIASIRVSNVDKLTVEGQPLVRLCNYTDVYYRDEIRPDQEFMEASATNDQIGMFRLRTGDVLITKDSETADDIAVPAFVAEATEDLICGYHLAMLRPDPSRVVPRFLYWAIRSDSTRDQFTNAATGVTRYGLRTSEIGGTRIALPSLRQQRAIADFLDTETARIDAIAERRVAMTSLLRDRHTIVAETLMRKAAERYGVQPLKHATRRIEVGIVVTPANWYVQSGTVALRGVNVRPGELVLDDVVHLSDEGHRIHRKSVLRTDDVVVVRTGQAGAAALIPAELDGCNCVDLVIVRPSRRLLPKFVELVLNSDWTQKHIEAHSVGTIQSHFNVGAMKHLPVPVPPPAEQDRIVARLTEHAATVSSLVARMDAQAAALQEHRQALITAAVTGQLDVTRAVA